MVVGVELAVVAILHVSYIDSIEKSCNGCCDVVVAGRRGWYGVRGATSVRVVYVYVLLLHVLAPVVLLYLQATTASNTVKVVVCTESNK